MMILAIGSPVRLLVWLSDLIPDIAPIVTTAIDHQAGLVRTAVTVT